MPTILPSELVTWGEVNRLCQRLAAQINASNYQPEIVIAIGRGGYVPARLVCDALDIMALTSIKIEHYLSGASKQAEALIRFPLCVDVRNQRVLIVDDVNDSGDTLKLAAEHIQSFQPCEIRTAVMHDKRVTQFRVDFAAKRIIRWRWLIYPWAIAEDISGFVKRLSPSPRTLVEVQQGLEAQFCIRVPIRILREVNAARGLLPP